MARSGSVNVVYEREVQDDPDLRDRIDPTMRQLAKDLGSWANQARAATNRSSLFDRGAYAAPDNPYDQMRIARRAVANDDIVGGIAEVTEGLAFDGVKWESNDPDDSDVFNQMAAEQNLDAVVRRMFRESFSCSQTVLGFWWDSGTFNVRGETKKGNKRKRVYEVWYPKAITTLDITKVVPVGMMAFGQERLAWAATPEELAQYQTVLDGVLQDELMERFYAGQYTPADPDEIHALSRLKVDISRLILLQDDYIKRFCMTKQDYDRFADVRLKRAFKLLDLKQQLMEADRVALIGAANYILLVKKGDKDDPAYPEEITNLKQNFDIVAKLPVIFSDHRLTVEIISPKTDFVLQSEKYDVLDNRIAATTLGLFSAIGASGGNRSDNSLQEARLVARNLENQRHMIRRFLEKEIARAVMEHPRNQGVFAGSEPNLTFVPGHISLDSDTGFAQQIVALRTMNELSRESVLEYFGFDQEVEAMRRKLEEELGHDDTFQTMVPFSSPAGGAPGGSQPPAAQGVNGARGGRPAGGGQPTRNPTKAAGASKSGQQSTRSK